MSADRSRLFVLAAAATLAGAADAREIHYGAVAGQALLECDRAHWQGRLDESGSCYQALLRGDHPAAIRAEAAWALNDLQLANRLFRAATVAAPEDAAILVRWGDLFADSHQDAEAMDIYREALGLDADNAYALLGAARLLVGAFDEEANAYLRTLLDDDGHAAGARAAGWLLVARASLESGDRDQADEALRDAESLLKAGDWPPLELFALRAAADLLDNVTDSEFTNRSLAFNPHWGNIHAIPAHFYVITRRYREAIDLYQKAVDVDPGLSGAHEELGVNLMRDNQMDRARRHLEIAYELDPFSPKAVNTLRLLDSFENFEVVTDPPVPGDGLLPIVFRLHRDEAAAILPYAIRLTRASIDAFTARYGFELREPVVVEMYPDHEDFAVRTAGMPGLGILGATFGYVVAMDSPSSRPPDQFQWGTTLWHEMAHVFTLEATNHLVPRWFSEGVSVYEEWQSGPNRGVRIPMTVYNAMREDRFLPIAELDEGFIRPTYEEQVIVSYMQGGLICQFIETEFGAGSLKRMLDAFARGLSTPEAVADALGIDDEAFDRRFEDFVDVQHGAFLERFDDWHHGQEAIGEAIAAADWERVVERSNEIIEWLPGYAEPDSPYLALGRAYDESGERAAATDALWTFFENGGYDPAALKQLGDWLTEAGRTGDAIEVLYAVNLVDPLDAELHGALGDLLLEAGEPDAARREFQVLLGLDPHDKASAWYRMASTSHALGDADTARAELLQALDIAPGFRPAQRLLLELMRAGDANAQN